MHSPHLTPQQPRCLLLAFPRAALQQTLSLDTHVKETSSCPASTRQARWLSSDAERLRMSRRCRTSLLGVFLRGTARVQLTAGPEALQQAFL